MEPTGPDIPLRETSPNPAPQQEPALPQVQRLSDARKGSASVVTEVLDSPHQARLMEIGFFPGALVEMVTPGDPAIVDVGGCRFALAKQLLRGVIVAPLEDVQST